MSSNSSRTIDLDQAMIGRLSRADSLQQQNMEIFPKRRATMQLKKVTSAIQSITIGEYGVCQTYGPDIGHARLGAQPEINLCFSCQDKADQKC